MELLSRPYDFELMQAIRILERSAGGRRLGDRVASEENIRLRPAASMAFAPADIAACEEIEDPIDTRRRRFRLTTRLLGLYGVTSPLPTAYAESIAQADPDDTRLRDFLDLFHHRLLSLLYRAWSRQHYIVEFAADGSDDLSQRLLVWLGIDRRLADALGLAPVELLRHASLFVGRTRSRPALETFFQELVGVPVSIAPNIGRWVEIPADQRSRLGQQSMVLGGDFVIGRRVFDRSGKFRIILGPVDYDTYETFLPGAVASHRLDLAVRAVLTAPMDYEIEVLVRASDRARFQLGRNRLGWDAWAGNQKSEAAVLFQAAGGSR